MWALGWSQNLEKDPQGLGWRVAGGPQLKGWQTVNGRKESARVELAHSGQILGNVGT